MKINSINLSKLNNCLKKITYTKNMSFRLIRICFLKYSVDNFIGANTKEDYVYYSNVKDILLNHNFEKCKEAVAFVLSKIDEAYMLDGLINTSINEYIKDFFGIDDNFIRNNASEEQFKTLMGEVAALDLSGNKDESKTFAVGKKLISELLPYVYDTVKSYKKQVGEHTTQINVIELACNILNVKDGEVFCDFASGIGASTINIVKDVDVNIYNVETNKDIATIASMLYIMNGYKKIKFLITDAFSNSVQELKADKIFVDPPINFNTKIQGYDYSNITIERAINYLNDGGMAVLAVSNTALNKNYPKTIEQRKQLFENGYINSVITLPPCWTGVAKNTNLIVLSKRKNENILFIDASNNKYQNFYKKERNNYYLTNEGIQTILNVFANRNEIVGVSKVVNILNDNFSLQSNIYIDNSQYLDQENYSITTINEEIKELYLQFNRLFGLNLKE